MVRFAHRLRRFFQPRIARIARIKEIRVHPCHPWLVPLLGCGFAALSSSRLCVFIAPPKAPTASRSCPDVPRPRSYAPRFGCGFAAVSRLRRQRRHSCQPAAPERSEGGPRATPWVYRPKIIPSAESAIHCLASPGLTRIFHGFRQRAGVAQTSSLLYRGFPIRRRDRAGTACRLEVGDTAGWKPALRNLGSPVPPLACEIFGFGRSPDTQNNTL